MKKKRGNVESGIKIQFKTKVEEVTLDDSNAVDLEKEELIVELNKYKDLYLRTLAEFENYKSNNEEKFRKKVFQSKFNGKIS